MQLRTVGYAAAAAVATFLIVFVAVTEALLEHVAFSVLVGVPAGAIVGAVAAGVVLMQLGPGADPSRQAPAVALGTFGIVMLAAFATLTVAAYGLAASLVVASGVGAVVGLGAFVRQRRRGVTAR